MGVTLTILHEEAVIRRLNRLHKLDARQKDIYAAFKRGAKPLQVAAKSNAPRNRNRNYKRGPLWRSIKVIKSKKWNNLFWLGPARGRSQKFDGWYGIFSESGTQGRGHESGKYTGSVKATRFMTKAFSSHGGKALSQIKIELNRLIAKLDR